MREIESVIFHGLFVYNLTQCFAETQYVRLASTSAYHFPRVAISLETTTRMCISVTSLDVIN